MLDFKNIPNEKEDLLFSTKFKSTCLLDDTHLDFTDAKCSKLGNKSSFEKINHTAGFIQEKYSEKLKNDKSENLEESENVHGLQTSPKTQIYIKSQPYIRPDLHEHEIIKNTSIKRKHRSPCRKRWGHDKDVLVFKTLQKL